MSPTGSSETERVHFGCSRCGACCNSSPQLSLPELFRHQTRFVGCLSIRRLPRPPASDARAATELDSFFARYAQRGAGTAPASFVFIAAQAYDDPLAARCPALGGDKLCSLQHEGKPLACRSVPLEAMLPDAFQLSVLEARAREAAYLGADCIKPHAALDSADPAARAGTSSRVHLELLVHGPRVVEPQARHALELRRSALYLDRTYWGDRVFELLRRDLFDHPERVRALPEQGFLCLSLAPALSVLSCVSNSLARRVVEYLSAQIELIALTLGAPAREPTQAQRELAGMLRANLKLRAKLQSARPLPEPQANATEIETWLLEPRREPSHG